MKDLIKVILVIFALTSLYGITGCAKKRLAVGSEGTSISQGGAVEKEQGVGPGAREARLRDLEASKGRIGGSMASSREEEEFEKAMIFFEFDRYDLTPEAKAILEKKASWLLAHPEYRLRIEGHCDERGTNEYNLALGDRRANAAKNYLVYLGVSPERISTISYGEERPLDPGKTEEAYRKNRRAEFKLIK